MKFLCLGYFDYEKMDSLPKSEIESVMSEKKNNTIFDKRTIEEYEN